MNKDNVIHVNDSDNCIDSKDFTFVIKQEYIKNKINIINDESRVFDDNKSNLINKSDD